MSGPRLPLRPSSRPKGFEDVPELSPEEVERRVDVRGGGSPPVPPPAERPVRDLRPRRGPDRTRVRDLLVVAGLVVVGLVTVRLVLPEGPLTVGETDAPNGSAAAIHSLAPSTLGPIRTPSLVTLAPSPAAPNRATVIVIMHVINNSGGSATASDWKMVLIGEIGTSIPNSFPGSEAGTAVSVPAGKGYRVVDDASQPGYAGRLSSAGCLQPEGGGGLAAGTTVTCTITRNDRPRVRVITDVIGGAATADEVTVTVDGANASPSTFPGSEAGVVVVVGFDLTYSVTQSDLAGYAKSSSGACEGSLGVDAPVAECTFTFDDDTPPRTGAAAPAAPLAWLVPLWGAAGLGGRRRWMALRSR